ncbi:uncharacterized protein LOC144784054 isoform X2 [Lissotriton helveticus]
MEQRMVGRDAGEGCVRETAAILGHGAAGQLRKAIEQEEIAIAELEMQLREAQRHTHHLRLCVAKEKEDDLNNWHQNHKQPISQEKQRAKGNPIQLCQEKQHQVEDERDGCQHHKSPICLEHEKNNGLDLPLHKKRGRPRKDKKVQPPQNTLPLLQDLPREFGHALQLCQELEEKESHHHHKFPICQDFESDRELDLQLLREKEKRAEDEKEWQGNRGLLMQPGHEKDSRRKLHLCPDKGETDIPGQHKRQVCQPQRRPSRQKLEKEKRPPLQLGQEKYITNVVQPHKPEMCRESGGQPQLNIPLTGKKELNDQEVIRITEKIRDRERKRQLKREATELRHLTTMNIGEIQTFDDVAVFFSPKEWKEWKEVDEVFQREDIKDLLDLKHLLGNQNHCLY